jgi:hypothetical protein
MVELHTLHGDVVQVNPTMVVSLRRPQGKGKQVMHGDVQCIVNFVDGKFITVLESCSEVRKKLEQSEEKHGKD